MVLLDEHWQSQWHATEARAYRRVFIANLWLLPTYFLNRISEQADRCDVFSDLWCEADEGWLLHCVYYFIMASMMKWLLQSNSSVMLCRSQRNKKYCGVIEAQQ